MSANSAELKRARSLRWGLPMLFVIAGVLLAKGAYEYEDDHLQLVEGLALATLGAGMMFNQLWARWLALGACFLVIVLACAYPMWVFLAEPFDHADRPLHMAAFIGIFVFVIGVLAFQTLSYLRSGMGREQYSADVNEGSAGVLVSAMLWGTVLFVLFLDMQLKPSASKPKPRSAAVQEKLADLEITGLCLKNEMVLMARVENRGGGGAGQRFQIDYSIIGVRGGMGETWGTSPASGESTWVTLDNAVSPTDALPAPQKMWTELDSPNSVRESKEWNNLREFTLTTYGQHVTGLPHCEPDEPE